MKMFTDGRLGSLNGISPKDQLPNHYRLLGIDLFEGDQDVIEAAVEQRIAHVRNHQIAKKPQYFVRLSILIRHSSKP